MREFFVDIKDSYEPKQLPYKYNKQVVGAIIDIIGEKWRELVEGREAISRTSGLFGQSVIFGKGNVEKVKFEYKRGLIMWANALVLFDTKLNIIEEPGDQKDLVSTGYDWVTVKNNRVTFGKKKITPDGDNNKKQKLTLEREN